MNRGFLQRTWVRLPARVPLLRVTPPLSHPVFSHLYPVKWSHKRTTKKKEKDKKTGLVIKKSVYTHSRESPSFPFHLLPEGMGSYILSRRPECASWPLAVVFAGCSSAAFWLRLRHMRQQSPLILWCRCGSCGPLHLLWALISAHLATWWEWCRFLSFFDNSIRIIHLSQNEIEAKTACQGKHNL